MPPKPDSKCRSCEPISAGVAGVQAKQSCARYKHISGLCSCDCHDEPGAPRTGPCAGAWIQLHSGKPFYLLDPKPEDFTIEDIAHALSKLCRFNGHTKRFYSVAEHSILVCDILRHWGHPDSVLRQGLLHDAAEAYIGDIVQPLKRLLPKVHEIEARIERTLSERFGLGYPWHPAVKNADNAALNIEREQLLGKGEKPWGQPPDSALGALLKPLPDNSIGPYFFKSLFKARAFSLGLG